jgi:hypothetical protein
MHPAQPESLYTAASVCGRELCTPKKKQMIASDIQIRIVYNNNKLIKGDKLARVFEFGVEVFLDPQRPAKK